MNVTERVFVDLGASEQSDRRFSRGDRLEDDLFEELEEMMADMARQRSVYQPTHFWKRGFDEISEELRSRGFGGVRRHMSSLKYFVPLYGFRPFSFEDQLRRDGIDALTKIGADHTKFRVEVERSLSGEAQAFSDYRVVRASDRECSPYLEGFSESEIGRPVQRFNFGGRYYGRSALNYMLGLCFLKKMVDTSEIRCVLEIGGGFGSLGEILLGDTRNDIFYIDVDLPVTGTIARYYLREIFGPDKILSPCDVNDLRNIDINVINKSHRAAVLNSWQIEKLVGKVDLAINFISFQEMEPDVVENYCCEIERLGANYVLLRNLREGKQQVTDSQHLGVREPILGDDYDKFLGNYKCLATNTTPFGYETPDGFHSELRLYIRKDQDR
jgi:putative sugar O-methyltransferase